MDRGIEVEDVATALGPVRFRGRLAGFDPGRVLVLALSGAFPPVDYFEPMVDRFPDCDVVISHLPGMHSRVLAEHSVEAFAGAYDEALARRFPGRAVLKVGMSLGGVVAMAMERGDGLVAIDPLIRTAPVWPIHEKVRPLLTPQAAPNLRAWIWNLLGVSEDEVAERDYRWTLRRPSVPGVILVAGEPLEPARECDEPPGVISAEDRAAMPSLTSLSVQTVTGVGHNIPRFAPRAIIGPVRALARLLQSQVPKPLSGALTNS